jgi:succinate dehydrogenase / fumarate reductase iron-sulfur subunit
MMTTRARLIVRRGELDGPSSVSTFDVPYLPGQSVLDGLRYVRTHLDSTLSVRYSCTNANTCKECMITIDGKVEYACTARLKPCDMILEPLRTKSRLCDLVTEIGPPDERLPHAIAKTSPKT